MREGCGNCGEPFARHVLDGHYGTRVEIDVCTPCHLLWFDTLESVRMSPTGLLDLIGVMAGAQGIAHRPLSPQPRCPRCGGLLKTVRNRSRFGPTLQIECTAGHGFAQTFAQWLSEKGLWRELSSADRARLRAIDGGVLHCLNCGGPLGDEPRCRWCTTPPGVIDIARLARAVDTEGATEADALYRRPLARRGINCVACGAALPPGGALRCTSCAATLAVGDLRQVRVALDAIAPALRQHQTRPAPHVMQRRLARQHVDLERGREWVREMEADTPPERDSPADAIHDLLDLWQTDARRGARWIGGLALLLALLAALWLA